MKHKFTKSLTCSAVALAIAAGGTTSYAQDSANSADQGRVIEELIVTARKKEETILDTPLAVSVFDRQEIENAGYTDIIEISKATPGLFIEEYNQAGRRVNTTPRFRGVFFSSGNRLAQTATIFLDGVYLSGGEQTIGINELERVEIIKGPQSTLFGRNTFSGAINYVTKDPTEDFRADVDLTVATGHETRFAVGVEGQIANGITGRLSGNFDHDRGDYANSAITDFDATLGDQENYSVSGTVVFTPNDRTRIKLRGSYREVDDGAAAFIATNGAATHNFGGFLLGPGGVADQNDSVLVPPLAPPGTPPGTPPVRTESVFAGTTILPDASRIGLNTSRAVIQQWRNAYLNDARLTPDAALLSYNPLNVDDFGLKLDSTRFDVHADFDLTNDISLSILGGYNEEAFGSWTDFDNTPDFSFMSFGSQELEDTSFEARVSGITDQFDWTVGVSYVDIEILGVNGNASFFGPTIMFGNIFRENPFVTGATTTGIFGSIDYRFTDQWSTALEARYQEDEIRDGEAGAESPVTKDNIVPRLTVKYEPNENSTFYGTYSEGNLAGGFNSELFGLDAVQLDELAGLAPNADFTFEEESLINYEFGWKQTFADGRAAFNLAAFYMERKDELFRSIELVTNTDPMPTNPQQTVAFTLNGASTDITGIEIDGTWIANDNLTFAGSIGYVDAEIASFPADGSAGDFSDIFGAAADVAGQEAPRYAPFTYSVNGTYEGAFNAISGFDSFYTRLDFFYNSAYYDSVSNVTEIGSALESNLRLGIRGENMGVELFATNLLNEDAPTAGSNFADISFDVRTRPGGFFDFSREGTVIGLRDKRQVGLRLKYTF